MESDTLLLFVGVLCVRYKRTGQWNNFSRRKIIVLYSKYLDKKRKEKEKRKLWTRPIFTEWMRKKQGHSDNLLREMKLRDPEKYFNYLRMSPVVFDKLLEIIGPSIQKQGPVRDPIPATIRLELTLRYLADGCSMISLSYDFRVGKSTVSEIIVETCEAIWNNLRNIVFPEIKRENWEKIAEKF